MEKALQRFRSCQQELKSSIARQKNLSRRKRKSNSKPRHVRRSKALEETQIKKVLSLRCCKKNTCLKQFETGEVMKWRTSFWEQSEDQQRQFLLTAFSLNMHYGENQIRKYNFSIYGKSVCHNAWYKLLGISNGWFYGLLKEYDEGRISGQSNRSGITWMSA
ncbi:hypothetical protein AC249_AIPGENE15319 [Exaiptasia diaphana]|nr:hypothetical protein AC249_AIPGENE15319 [Exaiptasia diaphana]